MKVEKFEDIIAWQKARQLSSNVYRIFSSNKDFSFKNQIERATVSIMNNIAEGFERQTDKEFKQFLYISKGSCGEVRSMVILAKDLGYITESDYSELTAYCTEISKILAGFIKTL